MKTQGGSSVSDILKMEAQHDAMRSDMLKILELLNNARRHSLFQLQKIQILFKYLNWKQQEQIERNCGRNFSLKGIISPSLISGIKEDNLMPVPAERTASYVLQIKTARKNKVQFELVKARAGELISSIVKSAAVFNHQYAAVCRELFPFGVLSRIKRSIRRFFSHPYYSWRELRSLQNLAETAGLVLKMAEAPVLGAKR